MEVYLDFCNSIMNLQLLEGIPNIEKSNMEFKEWLNETYKDNVSKQEYMNKNYIPNVSFDFTNFEEFVEKRKRIITRKIKVNDLNFLY